MITIIITDTTEQLLMVLASVITIAESAVVGTLLWRRIGKFRRNGQ